MKSPVKTNVPRPAGNATIASLLRQYAAALVIEGADRFRVKAYRRAAETIESLNRDVAAMVAAGDDLTSLPGIGKGLSGVLREIVTTGGMTQLSRAQAKLSPDMIELATKPALDPKKVLRIYKKLKIDTLAELRRRLDSGELGEVFGPRIEYHVRQGLDERPRMLLWAAEKLLPPIEEFLRRAPGLTQLERAGSVRRKKDTIGDIGFVATTKTAASLFAHFARYKAVASWRQINKREALYNLSSGALVHITWTPGAAWGMSLLLKTGAQAHLDELTKRAVKNGLALSEEAFRARKAPMVDEEQVYLAIGLAYIEPELREGRGEVAAAARGKLPALVRQEDLKGDLHMHTTQSDGANTLEEMAEAAVAKGYEYIAITDHSQSLKLTNGLSEKRLLEQIRRIDKFNARSRDLRVLKSAEVDILADGSLDYSKGVLKELDFTICSIHSRFSLNKQQQTQRILRAMDNRYFNILGHATGRLLLKREGYALDIEKIVAHAKASGCCFEINSSPDRLDLSDEHARLAKDQGVPIAINTDAHSIRELDFMSAGVNQARRAWLCPQDVLNTMPLDGLLQRLSR